MIISPAEPVHVEALATLAEEMDRFYGATESDPLDVRIQQIRDALFSSPPAAYAVLAWDESRPVGFASYSFLWPAVGLTRSLYLKELYVAEAARRTGIGRSLMQHLTETARKQQCSRIEWTTDRDNVEAQRFYASLGFELSQSKVFYRLSDVSGSDTSLR